MNLAVCGSDIRGRLQQKVCVPLFVFRRGLPVGLQVLPKNVERGRVSECGACGLQRPLAHRGTDGVETGRPDIEESLAWFERERRGKLLQYSITVSAQDEGENTVIFAKLLFSHSLHTHMNPLHTHTHTHMPERDSRRHNPAVPSGGECSCWMPQRLGKLDRRIKSPTKCGTAMQPRVPVNTSMSCHEDKPRHEEPIRTHSHMGEVHNSIWGPRGKC